MFVMFALIFVEVNYFWGMQQTLYDVWETNLELWDSVRRKRIDLQQLNLELKLNSVLSEQVSL